ncbi:hypothetical protein V6Z11_D11G401300, partial [Gossypium hirsutum]
MLFFCILSSVKLTRLLTPIGILPLRRFPPNLNWTVKEFKKSRSSTSPLPKGLEARTSHNRPGKPPKSILTFPVKLLPLISNSMRFEELDMDTGRAL